MKTVQRHWFALFALFLSLSCWVYGGVRRDIEDWYTKNYENKAMFLKIPVRGQKQIVHVRNSGPDLVRVARGPLYFKVGDQVRITYLDFKARSIRFKISSTNLSREIEINFNFPVELQGDFLQRAAFDKALQAIFTEGLTYSDIESAKEEFVRNQFDEFAERLSVSGNISNESVMKIFTEKIPAYVDLQEQVKRTQKRYGQAQLDLKKEVDTREQLQANINRQTVELNQARDVISRLRDAQEQLLDKTELLENQTDQFRRSKRGYENRLRQAEDLTTSLNRVTKQRADFSKKLERAQQQAMKLQRDTKELSSNLKRTQDKNKSLLGDMRALTSNKKGLQARYIDIKRAKESLESANDLTSKLSLENKLEKRQEGVFRVMDLYLLNQRLGQFEMKVPDQVGIVRQLRFSADSPDTVKFSEEERKLYELLGEDLKINAEWGSTSSNLKISLAENEFLQSVKPRESIEWTWSFQGTVDQPEPISLFVNLVNKDGEKIFLGVQDFTISSDQLWPRLRENFSPMSALVGVILTVVLGVMVLGSRRKKKSSPEVDQQEISDENVVFHKKF